MNILRSTEAFERWLGRYIPLLRRDLRFKHEQMALSSFAFLRATFYRWMQVWPSVAPDAASAPKVLAVGDVHVENFGTWRDIEGRLVWGINDFDEACRMPFTVDLVRLVTSAILAVEEDALALRPRAVSEAVLEGYTDALKDGGTPFVLGEAHRWLRDIAVARLRNPTIFWSKIDSLPNYTGTIPRPVEHALRELLPSRRLEYRRKDRRAGLGSLGHQRMLLMGMWRGGRVVREAKQLAPSACYWARERKPPEGLFYGTIIDRSVRNPDPFVRPFQGWLLRRLAPDCSRIEISSLPAKRDENRLLYAMGWETANIHLGSPASIPAVRWYLRKRPADWLRWAAKAMAESVKSDWKKWRDA